MNNIDRMALGLRAGSEDSCFICKEDCNVREDSTTAKVLYHEEFGPVWVHTHHPGVENYNNERSMNNALKNYAKQVGVEWPNPLNLSKD
jgi:hypothetical protein